MTKKELYTAMNNYFTANATEETAEFFAEAAALCEKEANALDHAAKRNAEKRAEKAKENEPMYDQIRNLLNEEGVTAPDVAAALEISVQKASSMLRALAAADGLVVTDKKVKGKGTLKAYAVATE